MILVQDTIPVDPPDPGQETVVVRNTATTPYTMNLYSYSGGAWVDMGAFSGGPSARILILNGNPNSQPSSYGNNGDMVVDNGTPNQVTIWTRTGPGVWASVTTLNGASTTLSAEVFRVGKAAPQPIPLGTTDPTIIQFELSTGSGLYNGGWWNGSAYNGETGISTPMTFLLENMRMYTTGAAETLDFVFDILVKTISEAQGTISITAGTEGTLGVITTGPEVVDDTVVVQVTVTPSVNPTSQWYFDFTNAVLYNQT